MKHRAAIPDLSDSLPRSRAPRSAPEQSRLGAIALQLGMLDKEQLRKTLRRQRALRKRDRLEARVGELLVAAKILDAEQLAELLVLQGKRVAPRQISDNVRALRKKLRQSRRRRKTETPTTEAVVASVDSADISQDADVSEADPYREQSNEFLAWLEVEDPKAFRIIQQLAKRQ